MASRSRKNPSLVGICGVKYSGKTTLAGAFRDCGYSEITFDGPMVDLAQLMFGLTHEECTDLKHRQEKFWIDSLAARVDAMHANEVNVVVSDVRFLNEAQYILDNGGLLLVVRRNSAGCGDEHPSETVVDEIIEEFGGDCGPHHPYIRFVDNNGTIDELKAYGFACAART